MSEQTKAIDRDDLSMIVIMSLGPDELCAMLDVSDDPHVWKSLLPVCRQTWYWGQFQQRVLQHDRWASAIIMGHLDVVKWHHEHDTPDYTPDEVDRAICMGHPEIAIWLMAHRDGDCTHNTLDYALQQYDSQCYYRDHEEMGLDSDETVIQYTRLLQDLHERHARRQWNICGDEYAAYGRPYALEWLHQHGITPLTHYAFDWAAANGHLTTLHWLHTNTNLRGTTNALDNAARYGHLAVVQWLHDHRTEGCTTNAVDGAAAMGHLPVVQWLLTHRTEGYTENASIWAVRNGHPHVDEYLSQNQQFLHP